MPNKSDTEQMASFNGLDVKFLYVMTIPCSLDSWRVENETPRVTLENLHCRNFNESYDYQDTSLLCNLDTAGVDIQSLVSRHEIRA